MTAQATIVGILLAAAVLLVLASAIGVLAMQDTYQRVHYVTPAAFLAPLLVGLAVLVQSGWSVNSSETWLALVFIMIAGPFLSHATLRAARIRETGDWRSRPAGSDRAGTGARPEDGDRD
jgi:multisubunit Na+/H+ antiporter MnhG subunit